MRYLLLYCPYAPDAYYGHKIETIIADTLEDAKVQAKKILTGQFRRDNYEFRLVQIEGHDSNYRLWDTREEPNESGNEYTTGIYWEKFS